MGGANDMSKTFPHQETGGVQNAQPHQYHASLVINVYVCNDDITMDPQVGGASDMS